MIAAVESAGAAQRRDELPDARQLGGRNYGAMCTDSRAKNGFPQLTVLPRDEVSMMVTMTSCAPRHALSAPATPPAMAPPAKTPAKHRLTAMTPGVAAANKRQPGP